MSVDSNFEGICLAPGCRRIGNKAILTQRFIHGCVIPDPFAYEDTELSFFDRIEKHYADVSWLEELYIGPGTEVISNMAFVQCGKLKRVVIAEGVTSIGEGAFKNCFSLTSILLPNSLTSIGHDAFSDCSSLTSIVLPQGVTSIGEGAFWGCSSLTSIVLPEGVTSIGNRAFSGCKSLASIVLPRSLASIGREAFSGCRSLAISAPGGSYAEKYARESGIFGIKVAPSKMPVPPAEKTSSAAASRKGLWNRLFGKDK